MKRCICGHSFWAHWWHESIQWFQAVGSCTRRRCGCEHYQGRV